jgi:hypothetical protein
LAFCALPPLAAEPLAGQRLFTTPAQRARLDGGHGQPQAASRQEPAQASAPPAQRAVTLTGIVDRPDGPSAYWLDGRRFRDGQALPAGVAGRRGRVAGDGVVITRADGTTVHLAPTEVLAPRPRQRGRDDAR